MICPYCYSQDLKKFGKYRYKDNTRQRYKCLSCEGITVSPIEKKPLKRRVSFLARRGDQPTKRIGFYLTSKTKLDLLWSKIYTLIESKVDDSKYINPLNKDNPHYRSGVNDGLRVALHLLTKIKGKPRGSVASGKERE